MEQKIAEYRKYRFDNPEFKEWLAKSDIWNAVFSCLRLRGVEMNKNELVDVVNGVLLEDLPLDIYAFVHRFIDMHRDMQECIIMQNSLDASLFSRFYDILTSGNGLRRDNPVLYRMNYIPPHFLEIPKLLNEVFRENALSCVGIASRISRLYTDILKIYPYGDDSPVMAYAVVMYELMKEHLPLFSITADKEEFEHIMCKDIRDGSGELAELLERSMINRLEVVLTFGMESFER